MTGAATTTAEPCQAERRRAEVDVQQVPRRRHRRHPGERAARLARTAGPADLPPPPETERRDGGGSRARAAHRTPPSAERWAAGRQDGGRARATGGCRS